MAGCIKLYNKINWYSREIQLVKLFFLIRNEPYKLDYLRGHYRIPLKNPNDLADSISAFFLSHFVGGQRRLIIKNCVVLKLIFFLLAICIKTNETRLD